MTENKNEVINWTKITVVQLFCGLFCRELTHISTEGRKNKSKQVNLLSVWDVRKIFLLGTGLPSVRVGMCTSWRVYELACIRVGMCTS